MNRYLKIFLVLVLLGSAIYALNTGLEFISKPHDMSVIAGVALALVAICLVVGAIRIASIKAKSAAVIVIVALIGTGCNNRIDAGHVGLRVKDYGTERGVNDIAEVTGRVFYNPFTERIIEVPTFVQNAVYTADERPGSEKNEEFRVTTKDGLVVSFDVSMNYHVTPEVVAEIFRKYRRPFDELQKGVMWNYLRDAFNTTASRYNASELYEKRAKFQQESEDAITQILERDGFIVDQIVLLNELRLPKSVVDNIEAKVSATQMALRKEAELQQATADAAKMIATARGDSASSVIHAAGQAEAFQRLKKELSPELIQMKFVERWDGKLPVYGTVPQMFKQVQ